MRIKKIYTSYEDFKEGVLSPEIKYSFVDNKLYIITKDITSYYSVLFL